MKIKFLILAVLPFLLIFASLSPDITLAQAGNAYDMVNGINELRATNGLGAYSINASLMAAAQYHADWITATNLGGHVGEGGSSAYDRAILFGYGGGAAVSVTENWARGYGLSVYDCIYTMWNDPDHWNNMLHLYHNEIGVGVSVNADNFVTYVVNFGHVSGSAPPPQVLTPIYQTQVPYIAPLQTSTPNPDGSIYHVVKENEFLITIAESYSISLDELFRLNNLTEESTIYPGDVLIIRISTTPEATATPEITKTLSPTATLKPSNTPRPSLTPFQTPTSTAEPDKSPGLLARIFTGEAKYLGIGLIAIIVLGVVLLIISSSRLQK